MGELARPARAAEEIGISRSLMSYLTTRGLVDVVVIAGVTFLPRCEVDRLKTKYDKKRPLDGASPSSPSEGSGAPPVADNLMVGVSTRDISTLADNLPSVK
ncbi:hypothetical protein KKH23_06875 [Patescibacteria group bacterium]|nr:hypothetical protein [Patescibacteria group bacterium]